MIQQIFQKYIVCQDEQLEGIDAKRVTIVNFCCLVVVLDITFFTIKRWLENETILSLLIVYILFDVLFVAVFVLQRYKKYLLAKTMLFLSFVTILSVISTFIVTNTRFEYNFIGLPILSLLLFEKKWVHYLSLIGAIAMFLVPYYITHQYNLEDFILFEKLFLFVICFSIVNFFKNVNQKNEQKLLEANKRLETQKQNELAHLQLKHLRSQMNPHFMFNFLNNIEGLIVDDKKSEAYTYLAYFSNLLRQTLDISEDLLIPLEKEIQFIRNYLEIEKMRLNNTLNYDISVREIKDTSNVKIPSMLIQPLVENAIKHGLFHKKGDKQLQVLFEKHKSYIICTIRDNGIGREKSKELQNKNQHLHIATNNIKTQIEQYKELYNLELDLVYKDWCKQEQSLGTEVQLKLPYST